MICFNYGNNMQKLLRKATQHYNNQLIKLNDLCRYCFSSLTTQHDQIRTHCRHRQ
jgi:hypothetical protein